MSDTNKQNSTLDSKRDAYQQIYRGSATLLDMNSLSWTEKLLLGQVKALTKRRLDQTGKDLAPDSDTEKQIDELIVDDKVLGDHIVIGGISGTSNVAVGRGATIGFTQGTGGRDEQYKIAKQWDGQQLMCGFDLCERDLSGLNLANADLRKANLKAADLIEANLVKANLSEADLSDTDLLGADLSGAKLNGSRYTANTTWPKGFDPEKAGAVLIEGEEST